jgi:DNA-binding transcriptional LysR family regulator
MYEQLIARKGLSVERLHALVLLSDHGSLIKAAKGDFGLQSRYSHHIRELSAFMGIPLTRKEGRSIRLTPVGEELANLARTQFRAWLEFQSKSAGSVQQVALGAGDSLLQWLLLPALGKMRRMGRKQNVKIENLRTNDLVRKLQEQRIDLGLIRANAVTKGLDSVQVCVVKYVVVVPRRLAPRRLTLETSLLECPHATMGGDGELVQKLQSLVTAQGGTFRPELICDSAGQCMAAVRTGSYAAVIPTQVWENDPDLECEVVDDNGLSDLDRPVVLAWSPRNLESIGAGLSAYRDDLKAALIDEAELRGMIEREN